MDGCSDYAGFAADRATDYSNSGESDWFLPSKDELNKLYINRASVGGFSSDAYWSSSENVDDDAWGQGFNVGSQGGSSKDLTFLVRPVRSF